MRSAVATQGGFDCDIGLATVSRAERGLPLQVQTALKIHTSLKTEVPFDSVFELVAEREPKQVQFSWDQLTDAAERVGRKIFFEFGANSVLTFSGASAIFASLTMTRALTREQILVMPFYTAIFLDKIAPAELLSSPGFEIVRTRRFIVLLPKVFGESDPARKRRVVLIDDSVTTGSSMRELKDHLIQHLGYAHEQVCTACCVCYANADEKPDVIAFESKTSDYRLPWGERL